MDEQPSGLTENEQNEGFDAATFEAAFGENGDKPAGQKTENQETESQETGNQETKYQETENRQSPDNSAAQDKGPPAEQDTEMIALPLADSRTVSLPAEAVRQLAGALGSDPVVLLQKGMAYDGKAARELQLLDRYAAAAGMSREQYIAGLEQQAGEQQIMQEAERVKTEFPGTPDDAARVIARQRMEAARSAEQQREWMRQAELQQGRERVNRMVEDTRRQAQIRAWDEYERLAGVHRPEEIPPRVMELVQNEGMTPAAAHWRFQAEQAREQVQIERKTQQNAGQSAGSMTGAASDTQDPFLRAFLGA